MNSLSSADTERLREAFLRCRDMEGTLAEQLEAYAAAGRKIFPAYSNAVDRLVDLFEQGRRNVLIAVQDARYGGCGNACQLGDILDGDGAGDPSIRQTGCAQS